MLMRWKTTTVQPPPLTSPPLEKGLRPASPISIRKQKLQGARPVSFYLRAPMYVGGLAGSLRPIKLGAGRARKVRRADIGEEGKDRG